MLGIVPREAIAITTQDRRDEPHGHWKPLRGYLIDHARWLTVWESYGSYWCARGDKSPDWQSEVMNVDSMRKFIERHRQEQRVFKDK